MSDFKIRTLGWRELWLLARPLMESHARQFSLPDLESYIGSQDDILNAEKNGLLDCTLALYGSTSVGYLCWLIGQHNGLPGARVARMGPWYIEGKQHGLAPRMFQHSLDSLRGHAVKYVLPTFPLKRRQIEVLSGGWLHHFGARPFEVTWMIELQGAEGS